MNNWKGSILIFKSSKNFKNYHEIQILLKLIQSIPFYVKLNERFLHDCLKLIQLILWKAKTVPFHIETAENPVCLTQKRSDLTLSLSLMDSVHVYQKHGCMLLPIAFIESSKWEKWRFSTNFDTLPWAIVKSQLLISDKINWRNLSKLCTSILPIWQIGLLKVHHTVTHENV